MLAAVCRLSGASLAVIKAVSRVLGTLTLTRVARMLAVPLLLVDSLFAPRRKNSAPLTGAVGLWLPGPGAGKPVRPFPSVSSAHPPFHASRLSPQARFQPGIRT